MFESRQYQGFSLLHVVQTDSENHKASWRPAAGTRSWPLIPKYRRGQEYVDINTHFSIRLHGIALN
jgi:hypothetical protein